jgi:hypothetical protein
MVFFFFIFLSFCGPVPVQPVLFGSGREQGLGPFEQGLFLARYSFEPEFGVDPVPVY